MSLSETLVVIALSLVSGQALSFRYIYRDSYEIRTIANLIKVLGHMKVYSSNELEKINEGNTM